MFGGYKYNITNTKCTLDISPQLSAYSHIAAAAPRHVPLAEGPRHPAQPLPVPESAVRHTQHLPDGLRPGVVRWELYLWGVLPGQKENGLYSFPCDQIL